MIRLVLLLVTMATAAFAQDRRPSHCIAIADSAPGIRYLQKASFRAPVPEFSVRLQYIAHASFLIQSEDGLSAVTDFTGFIGNVDFIPDVVTMNHAHSTHWTPNPDPAIPHVLRGWGDFGEGADHHVDLGGMVIRNVPTDIRSYGRVEPKGNSIFVFEAAGLCIGHLGHLHHSLGPDHYAAIGRLDVVMAAVDGTVTLDLQNMIALLKRVRASVVLPMHYWSPSSLDRFLQGMSDQFRIINSDVESLRLTPRTLPTEPSVFVMPRWRG
jgi:L-ascorbate metabolism protein UlaG (beta-lactamase superfamily)